jgi:hypothetical protein
MFKIIQPPQLLVITCVRLLLLLSTTAAAGYHLRSIAVAAIGLSKFAQPTVQEILTEIHMSVHVKARDDLPIIKEYVVGACKGYKEDNLS